MEATSRIGEALKLYADSIRPYLLRVLKEAHGNGQPWLEAFLSVLGDNRKAMLLEDIKRGRNPEDLLDINHVKDLLLEHHELFRETFGRNFQRAVTWADEISEVRNAWAHQQPIPPADERRALDSMAQLLVQIKADEAAQSVRALMENALPAPKGHLPSWWQLAQPDTDIRRGNFDENTFAAKLDDVVSGRASTEYRFADEFFKKTYITQELGSILKDTLRRLAGMGGEAVVQLRTPFGGGKTHALIALYHLAKAYSEVEDLPDIQALLRDAQVSKVPRTRIAVLVGTDLSAQGRTADGLSIYTLWGELAYQLGGPSGYVMVQSADQNRTPPGKEVLHQLLDAFGPALILMDELLVYQVKAAAITVGDSTLQAQTFAFLQELTEVVGGQTNSALVTTFPESYIEYYDSKDAPEVFARLEKIFGRVQAVRMPVQGEEIYEVLRRRLFSQINSQGAKEVVAAYQQIYAEHKDELPSEVRSGDYSRKMLRAFPFHPELVKVLYERWGTIPGFQKTRGVLRLLARVVESSYLSPAARPLIGLGDANLQGADLRATVTSVLPEGNWEAVLASDIVPDNGKAYLLDKEQGGEYARHQLGQSVSTAIFFYSHSGGAERGVSRPQLHLSLLYPHGITPLLIGDALDKLKGRLYYLYANGGWTFKTQPNLNAVLADRMAQVKADKAEELLREYTEKIAGGGVFKTYVWPHNHRDVPDGHSLKLIILGPNAPHDDSAEMERQYHIIQDNHASGPRVYKNTTVYLSLSRASYFRVQEVARRLLALQDIQSDRGLVLSDEQKQELTRMLKDTQDSLPSLIKASYTTMLEPEDAKGSYRQYDLTAHAKTKPTLQEAVIELMRNEDRLLSALDPAYLVGGSWGLWPQDEGYLSLKELREHFFRLPHLPFIQSDEVIKEAVKQGVRIGLFELGVKVGDQFGQVWHIGKAPESNEVFLGESYFLARPNTLPRPEVPPTTNIPTPPIQPASGGTKDVVTPDAKDPLLEATRKTKVRVELNNLELTRIPALIDLVNALKDAGGVVRLRVEVEANNPQGLNETVLRTSALEIIEQYNLNANWHEE